MKIGAKWPRNKTKVGGKKSAIKHVFFSKRGQDFVLLKQVPESSHQTNYLAGTNMLGH